MQIKNHFFFAFNSFNRTFAAKFGVIRPFKNEEETK